MFYKFYLIRILSGLLTSHFSNFKEIYLIFTVVALELEFYVTRVIMNLKTSRNVFSKEICLTISEPTDFGLKIA